MSMAVCRFFVRLRFWTLSFIKMDSGETATVDSSKTMMSTKSEGKNEDPKGSRNPSENAV